MSNKTNKTTGLIAMGIVVLIYGVSYISREALGGKVSTTAILAIQMGIMTVFFAVYNLLFHKSFKVNKKDLGWIIASGLFGTTFFNGFTILGIKAVGATISSLLFSFAAAFALIIEVVLFHRKKTVLGFVSIAVSLVGIFILMDMDLADLAATNFTGYLLGLGSVVSWVIYTFLCDHIPEEYEKTVVLSYQAVVGVVTTLPFAFMGATDPGAFAQPSVIGNLLFLGLFNSSIAYFLNMYAIKNIGVTLSNLLLNFLPVVTMILAIVLNHTIPTVPQIVGGILILCSVFMLNKDQQNIDKAAQS